MGAFDEGELERATLEWLAELGWAVRQGATIAPGEPEAERDDYREVLLTRRLATSLARINTGVATAIIDEAVRRVARAHQPTPLASNRAFHRMLVDGLEIETAS